MNKAVCIREHVFLKIAGIEVGDEVEYQKDQYRVVNINGHHIECKDSFFMYFDVIEGDDKMSYSEFENTLINEVFQTAVGFPNKYDGVRHLVIQRYGGDTIMITISSDENTIRVSYSDHQEVHRSYEEALNGIIENLKHSKE